MAAKTRHLVHIDDLTLAEIQRVLDLAEKFIPQAKGGKPSDVARGRILSTLFFEPSTRTRLSFEAAMARLGGTTVGFSEPATSSVVKGETLADTIRIASSYADLLVLRHPHEGAARLASRFSSVPVVNGGDGAGQHPTQTLLDLFTIRREKGRIEGNRVALVGDLKYGRTVHSLAHALARFKTEMTFVAPDVLQMPAETKKHLDGMGAKYSQTKDLESVVGEVDVVYVTRIQKERFPDPDEYKRVAGVYQVTADLLAKAKKGTIVLHPLPRVNEITPDVDRTEHAKYFEQAFYGVPVRMAVISLLLGMEAW